MANNNESTMKWKVDITQLKSAMQEAQNAIKQANAEFKTATAGMDKWSKSSEGLEAKLDQLNKVLPEQKKVLETLEKQYETTAKELGENSTAANDLKLKIENQKAAIVKTETSIKTYTDKLSDMKAKQAESETATGKLSAKIADQETELKQLKTAYANATLEYGENSDEAKDLAKQIEDLSGELKDNKTQLKNATDAADDLDQSLEDLDPEESAEGFTAMKVAIGNLIAQGISKLIESVKDFATESIDIGKEFDSSMSQVSAVSGATGDELDALRQKAKDMGSTTKFTASQAADAFNYMAMAGWKTEDMLNGIDGVLNLAAASGADLATTSDIVTDALTAMGYSAKDAGRLADVMAAAASNANTNVEMMGGTFKYAAPVAGALGYSMEDTALAIGLMANSGIKAEMAGTSLRSILTRLATDAGASSKSLGALGTLTEELGVQFYNTDGTTRDLSDVLMECREAWAGLSEEQQTSYGKQIAGQEALSAWLAIMNAAPEDVEKLTVAIENCDGAAEQMATTMLDNLGGDMTILQSQLEGVQLSLYEKLEPTLRSGVEVLSGLLDKIQWLIDNSDIVIGVITGLATAVGAYVLITQGATIATNLMTAAQTALNAVMAMNPIGIVIAAIAGLVAAFVVLWNKSEDFRNFWIGLWESITGWISQAVKDIGEFFTNLWEDIKSIWETVSGWFDENVIQPVVEFFKGLWDSVSGFFKDLWQDIKDIWNTVSTWFDENVIQPVVNFFKDLWESVSGFFTDLWEDIKSIWETVANWFNENVVEPVKEFFAPLVEWFIELFTSIWNFIESVFTVIWQLAEGCVAIIMRVWEVVSGWFDENVIQPVKQFFTDLWNTISNAASAAWEFIKNIWLVVSTWFNNNVIQPVVNFFVSLWNTITGAASAAWEAIKNVWIVVSTWFNDHIIKPVVQFFVGLWNGLRDGARNAWEGIKNIWLAVSTWFNEKIILPVKNFFKGMWDGLKTGAKDAWQGIKNVFGKVKDWFHEKFKAAWEAVKNVFSTGGKIFSGIKEGIESAFKKVVNAIIRGINKVIAFPFNTINSVLDKIRAFTILGITPFAGLGSITVPQIPELARGGVLKRGQVGLLEGSGAEAVVPLENNRKWIAAVVKGMVEEMNIDGLKGTMAGQLAVMTGRSGGTEVMTQNLTFNQTINSPKAVDRLTLYRETNNLLFSAKVGLANV